MVTYFPIIITGTIRLQHCKGATTSKNTLFMYVYWLFAVAAFGDTRRFRENCFSGLGLCNRFNSNSGKTAHLP